MERTGNTVGAEGRRQHDEDDPRYGDKPDMEERIADREAREAEEEGAAGVEAGADEGRDAVPDPDDPAVEDVRAPEGVKPGTASEIAEATEEAQEEAG